MGVANAPFLACMVLEGTFKPIVQGVLDRVPIREPMERGIANTILLEKLFAFDLRGCLFLFSENLQTFAPTWSAQAR